MTDILDLHTHTTASGHAYNTLYEMVRSASEKGVKLIGVTEHGPKMPGACHPFYFINFRVVPRDLYGIRLLLGCELNIIDYNGSIDLKHNFLKGLDYAIASIHEPCYQSGTVAQNTAAYLGAIKNPNVQIIGHPDDGRFPVDYESLAGAAKEYGKLLEVNSSSLHPQCRRLNARENYITMLEYCRRFQTRIVIDSDAHCETDVGNHQLARDLLAEVDFPEELIVNSSIDRLRPYLPKLNDYWPLSGDLCHD